MKKHLRWLILWSILTITINGCSLIRTSPSQTATHTQVNAPQWGIQIKTHGCQPQGPLQDKGCTPGDIFPEDTPQQVCIPGYASSNRYVTQTMKRKVYAAYGITKYKPGQYQIDHLVSLQLGGSNTIANLWPESATPRPGFREKDQVENYLRNQMCVGKITLKAAQIAIATNWVAVYNIMPQKNNYPASDD